MSLSSCSRRAVTEVSVRPGALDRRADDDRAGVRRAQEVHRERPRLARVVVHRELHRPQHDRHDVAAERPARRPPAVARSRPRRRHLRLAVERVSSSKLTRRGEWRGVPLLLFDIDGTLMLKAYDEHRDAIHAALHRVYGVPDPSAAKVEAAGRTDPQIARAILLQLGVSSERVDDA